ncbi:MAG TPA: response regulator transcription factor [Terracidiphilus sp.]|nr:response regulator transcription factor [Terracidiphilus sp.]
MEAALSSTNQRSILLVDDDTDLCSLMVEFLGRNGFLVKTAYDGRSGLRAALAGGIDLMILDVMMPLLDGFSVLHQLRKSSAVPIIMLTARTEQADRIAGLDAGADDYLPKPFGPEELLSRIRAVLRRTSAFVDKTNILEVGSVRIDIPGRKVWRSEQLLDLTAVEFDILEFLVRAAGRVVSRDELTTMLYQRAATPYERTLDVHISHLRKKLGGDGQDGIRTVRGAGYVFSYGSEQ